MWAMNKRSWLDVFADYPRPRGATLEEVRRAIALLDDRLQEHWNLGGNVFIAWSSTARRTQVLALPHYRLVEYAASGAALTGPARLGEGELEALAGRLALKPLGIELPFVPDEAVGPELMGALVQRYGVAYTKDRPVMLVDVVDFSLYPAVEQVVLLQSLSHSLNSAFAKLAARNIRAHFARSTTGDGFYVWNRIRSLEGSVDLYRLMLLMLADNAIAQRKAGANVVPRLRAAFHVGPHYEFYQSEGLSPTLASYLVGEVTIALARMVTGAMPGQVLLGDFVADVLESRTGRTLRLGTVDFVERMREAVWNLSGIPVAGEAVREIRCYLTGPPAGDGAYAVNRYAVADKHGFRHPVFNAKINIHREAGDPIFLGMRNEDVRGLELQATMPPP
jgi:class 3 adenylate cyclase